MPTKSQELMIEDGAPAELVLKSQAERAAEWKGKRLRPTRSMSFDAPDKPLDPGTIRLLEERKAAERAAAANKKAADKEARKIKARQRAKPPGDQPNIEGDDTMKKKTAKKPARKARVTKTKNIGRARSASKKSAQASARTPAAPATGRKAEVAELMRRPEGVTTAQIKVLTGMLDHSARALISGITKGLCKAETVVKTKDGNNATVYAIRPAK